MERKEPRWNKNRTRWKWPRKARAPEGMGIEEANRRLGRKEKEKEKRKPIWQCENCGRKNLGWCWKCKTWMTKEELATKGESGVRMENGRLVQD